MVPPRDEHDDTPEAGHPPLERRKQATVFKDPRIDKLISWGLGLVGSIILMVGTWAINGFKESIHDIRSEVVTIRAEIGGARAEIKGEISDLRTEVALLKQRDTVVGELKASLIRLEDRLLRLERGGGEKK